MISKDLVEQDMNVHSPHEANAEEWIKPFYTTIKYETSLDFVDNCYMQMAHYYETFEDLGPHISGHSFMMSPPYSSCSREACCTEYSFADIQHLTILGYHSQLCSTRTVE